MFCNGKRIIRFGFNDTEKHERRIPEAYNQLKKGEKFMLKECTHILQLSGKGEDLEKAFYQVFAQIRMATAKVFPDQAIVQIDPKGVEVISAREIVSTEKFFGLLFPRKVSLVELTLAITVLVRMVDLSQMQVETIQKEDPLIKQILNKK